MLAAVVCIGLAVEARICMKAETIVLMMQAVALCTVAAQSAWAVEPTPDEMAKARQWAAARFQGDELFFSFTYNGRPSAELLKTWKPERTRGQLDDKRTQHTLAYTDPESGMVLRCVGVEYTDFPTVEWTLYFRNAGDKDTPILSDICPLDVRLEGVPSTNRPNAGIDFHLHHHVGSPAIEPRKSNVIADWPQVPGFRGSNGEQPLTLLTRNSIVATRNQRS